MMTNALIAVFLLFSVLFSRALFKTIWNPLSLFFAVWFVSIMGTLMLPINFSEISISACFLIIVNFVAMMLGGMVPYFALKDNGKGRRSDLSEKKEIIEKRMHKKNKKILKIIILLSFLGSLSPLIMVFQLYQSGNLYLITDFESHSRLREMSLTGGGISYSVVTTILLAFSVMALSFSGYYSQAARDYKKYIFIWPMLNLLFASLIVAGRSMLIWSMLLFISVTIYTRKLLDRKRMKISYKLVLSMAAFAAMIIILREWRGGSIEGVYEFTKSVYKDSLKWEIDSSVFYSLINFFSTISGSIPALSKYLEGAFSGFSFGNYTFLPFFEMMGGESVSFYYTPVNIPFEYNVFTYLRELYADFGTMGMVVFNFMLGFLTSYSFWNCRTRFNLSRVMILSFLTTFLLFSIWLPITYATMFWFSFFSMLALIKLIRLDRHYFNYQHHE